MKRVSPPWLAGMAVCLAAVLALGKWGPLGAFVHAVRSAAWQTEARPGTSAADALCARIAQAAPAQRIEPVNARVDRVWKAIPGYDGREADVAATCARARQLGLDPRDTADIPWVYRLLKPAINLEDLPPLPIYRGNPAKPMAALMINVAWGDEHLAEMLNTLEEEGVTATFFLDGTWLSKHAETAKDILRRGHELSNHAWSHPMMSRLSPARQREEIAKTETLLREMGVDNRWFAPPSGDYDDRTVQVAHGLGLHTVLWTLDTVDWKNPPADAIVQKISRHVGPGHLILMHPTASAKRALPGIIRAIRAKGLTPGTVSRTLSTERMERIEQSTS